MHAYQHYDVVWYNAIKSQTALLHRGPKLRSKVTIFPKNYEFSLKVPAWTRMISVFYDAINFFIIVRLNQISLILYQVRVVR